MIAGGFVSMKLGEMLVSAGKITADELEETLKGQAIFGGRFGTNLVEMGYLDEVELAQFLSQKLGVPSASPEQLMDLSPQVVRLLPEDAVKKYRVVPVALNNRKLSLAMLDPSDFATIDEISFVTGYIVVPLITPELRLVSALEKYYNIRREMRYIPVAGGGRNRGRSQTPVPPAPGGGQTGGGQAAAEPVPSRATAPPPAFEPEEEYFELLPLDEDDCFFGDLEAVQSQPLAPASVSGAGARQEPPRDYSLDGLLRGLTQAPDRHGIAELIVSYTGQQFDRSALFLIKGDRATGWVAQVGGQPLSGFETLAIPLSEPSLLTTVNDSKTLYLGPMPGSPCDKMISGALGGDTAGKLLLVPLTMMGRVVAILYVSGGARRLDESIPELQILLAKVSMAFEILILKSKILLT
jgi:hypothetical protein